MKTIILLKARLKENLFTTTYLKDLYKRDRLWVLPIAGLGIAAAAVFFVLLLHQNYSAIYTLGLQNGTPEIVILFAGIISGILVFFIGIPLCLSNIFYSKDNALAASLPVANADIVVSRILSLYLFTLPIHLIIIIPALTVFIPGQLSPAAVISSLIFSLSGPILPLIPAFAASAALVRIGNLSGKRTAVEIGGMTAAIVLLGAVQIAAGRSMLSGGWIPDISSTLTGYTVLLKRIFFASSWTASGFRASGTAYAALSLTFRIFIAVIFAFLLNLLKFNVAAAGIHSRSRKKQRRSDSSSKVSFGNNAPIRTSSPVVALLNREWTVVRSNSAFLFEIAGEVFVLPLLLVVFYISIPEDFMTYFHEITAGIDFMPGIILAMLILMSSINSVSSTSLSREGKTFAISKYVPLSGSTQVKAKMYFHMILFTASWYLNMTILILILRLPAVHLVYLIPAGPAVVLLGFITNIHIDLSRPVLNWTHPQQAMKQNMNVLTGLGFGLLTCAVLILPGAGLYLTGISVFFCGLITPVCALIADMIMLPKIMRYSDRRYIEITV